MLVHLVATAEKIEEDITYLRKIVGAIHTEGHTLACDWIEPAYNREIKKIKKTAVDWEAVYKENMEAITKADVIITETTTRSFGTGYQLAIAARLKKPILILRRDDAENDIMAVGITEETVGFKTYNDENLTEIVTTFLRDNDIQAKDMRFNFFIDRPIYNYLRWAAYKTGKTKAEILRELVSREIEKNNTTQL